MNLYLLLLYSCNIIQRILAPFFFFLYCVSGRIFYMLQSCFVCYWSTTDNIVFYRFIIIIGGNRFIFLRMKWTKANYI